MADIAPLGVTDWGNLMTSFGQGTAAANAANASAANTQAQTGLVNQQTQAAAMQNQLMKARMPAVLKALADYNPQQSDDSGAPPTGGNGAGLQATPGTSGRAVPTDPSNPNAPTVVPNQPADDATPDNWYDPARVDQGLRARYFVNPAGTPQEMQGVVKAAFIDPDNKMGLLEQAKQQRQLGVDSRLAASQNDASQLYDTMTDGVVNAPAGRALDALEAISPQAAAQIRKLIPDGMEEDEAARSYATHVANTVHQFSGRTIEKDESGQYRDGKTGNPLTGAQPVGLKPDAMAQLAAKGNELVTMQRSDRSTIQMPRFKAEGSPNLQTWLTKIADKNNVPGASPSITGVPRAQFQETVKDAAAKAPPPGAVPPQQPATAGGTPGVPGAAPGQPGQPAPAGAPQAPAAGGPVAIALQDKSFRSPVANAPVQTGVSQSKLNEGETENYVKQKAELQNSAGENSQAASQALASFRAAQAIMNAPDGSNIAGQRGAIWQELAKLGLNTDTGAHRIEAAKYLTNGALQNLKNVYGAKPGVFDVKVNLEQAFPNIKEMNDQSVKDLISSQIRNASYIRDSAARVPLYLAAKNDPSTFNQWNEKYFTRSNAVNEPAGQEQNQTKTSAATTGNTPALPKYANAAAVKADFQAGKLTRDQAKAILQQQHGMQ
jgi:hypothetical protein